MNKKNKGLGRGLSALLHADSQPNTADNELNSIPAEVVGEILMVQIDANPFQPRTDFDTTALEELKESILKQGIIQPVTLRPYGDNRFQLISGERRFRAAQLAGLEKIPAYIRMADDTQALEMALVENIQRENLNPIEIAITFQRLLDECDLTQEQLSEKVGKNRSTVTNFIRLLKLPAEIQVAVRDGQISMGHARALITIDSVDVQRDTLKTILKKSLSVRQVEDLVKTRTQIKKHPTEPIVSLPEKIEKIRTQISSKILNPVVIKRSKRGRGLIHIPFTTDKELERIMKLLAQ